jgi:prepilin-type N-terminal cleavage/methylation domain-containing protein
LAHDKEKTMTRIRSRNRQRSAFTLIELLVVIAIIAVLVSLSAAGVMKVLGYIPEVQTRTDISQMDAALGSFMADYGLQDPPPSYLILREDMSYTSHYSDPGTGPIELRSHQFLKQAFGKNIGAGATFIDWNGDGTANGPHFLQGQQCLVFYLGGIPNTLAMAGGSPPGCLGFSTNNNNPAQASSGRRGPYFNFLSSRLVVGTVQHPKLSGFFVYLDAWKPSSGVRMPYAYFSSSGLNNKYNPYTAIPPAAPVAPFMGGDCAYMGVVNSVTVGAYAYSDAGGNFTFSNKYQIISAGQDGAFGFNGGNPPSTSSGLVTWNPASGAIVFGRDDQANFSSKLLGAGQQ